MLGDIGEVDEQPNENRGMTPRVFEYLFAKILKVCTTISVNSLPSIQAAPSTESCEVVVGRFKILP